jgi:hypothetical protein
VSTRREFLASTAAAVAAAMAPALPAAAAVAPALGVDWWDEVELRAILRALASLPQRAFEPIENPYPEGTWEHDDFQEAQSFAQALRRVRGPEEGPGGMQG